MRKRIGQVEIDTIAAERSKFTAQLLLVHGLWCTNTVWHGLMGYLAHRGWDCHAINLRGRNRGTMPATSLHDHLTDIDAVVRACEAPPVIVGHDLGGLLALARDLGPRRAVVALAPLAAASHRPPIPGLAGLRTRLIMALAGHLPPPRGRLATAYFGSTPPRPTIAEPAAIVRELTDPQKRLPLEPHVPSLIVAGEADAVTPLETVEKLAHAVGADLLRIPEGGHALPWEPGWQKRGDEIHRWLIRTLGDPLLALLDEEEPE